MFPPLRRPARRVGAHRAGQPVIPRLPRAVTAPPVAQSLQTERPPAAAAGERGRIWLGFTDGTGCEVDPGSRDGRAIIAVAALLDGARPAPRQA